MHGLHGGQLLGVQSRPILLDKGLFLQKAASFLCPAHRRKSSILQAYHAAAAGASVTFLSRSRAGERCSAQLANSQTSTVYFVSGRAAEKVPAPRCFSLSPMTLSAVQAPPPAHRAGFRASSAACRARRKAAIGGGVHLVVGAGQPAKIEHARNPPCRRGDQFGQTSLWSCTAMAWPDRPPCPGGAQPCVGVFHGGRLNIQRRAPCPWVLPDGTETRCRGRCRRWRPHTVRPAGGGLSKIHGKAAPPKDPAPGGGPSRRPGAESRTFSIRPRRLRQRQGRR